MSKQHKSAKSLADLKSLNPTVASTRMPPLNTIGEDGVNHINIMTGGKTPLGRFLSIYNDTSWVHPYFGVFRSLSGYNAYITAKEQIDALRTVSDSQRIKKLVEQHGGSRTVKNALVAQAHAAYLRILQNPAMMNEMINSTLPFDIWRERRDTVIPVRERLPLSLLWTRIYEEIRSALKEKREISLARFMDKKADPKTKLPRVEELAYGDICTIFGLTAKELPDLASWIQQKWDELEAERQRAANPKSKPKGKVGQLVDGVRKISNQPAPKTSKESLQAVLATEPITPPVAEEGAMHVIHLPDEVNSGTVTIPVEQSDEVMHSHCGGDAEECCGRCEKPKDGAKVSSLDILTTAAIAMVGPGVISEALVNAVVRRNPDAPLPAGEEGEDSACLPCYDESVE